MSHLILDYGHLYFRDVSSECALSSPLSHYTIPAVCRGHCIALDGQMIKTPLLLFF